MIEGEQVKFQVTTQPPFVELRAAAREESRLKLPATKGDVERLEARLERIERRLIDAEYLRQGLPIPQEFLPPADVHDRVRLPRAE